MVDPVAVAAVGLMAAALVVVSAWRPAIGCALLILVVPLTTGLARGGVIPLLRPSEAATALVVCGVLVHQLPRLRRQELTWLDLAVGLFTFVGVVIPWLVLAFSRITPDVDTWRVILSPAQFFVVYLLFSRLRFTGRDLQLIVGLAMVAGAIVALVAVAELINVPGVRSAVDAFYAAPVMPAWDTTYRPNSLVGHYSAVGGLCLLAYILALALSATRHPAFSGRFLTGLMLLNLMGVVASQTFAPFLVVLLATGLLIVMFRRIPPSLVALGAGATAGLLLLWPLVSARVADQGLLSGGYLSLALPETMQNRIRLWSEFIVPALQDHLWLGTGTVIPGWVPPPLTAFVDNEYLWAGFRAGVPGIVVLLGLLAAVALVGWRERRAADPWRRAIGAAASASAVSIMVLGLTAQYITFGGVVQAFAMVTGLLCGLTARRSARPLTLVLTPAAAGEWRNALVPLRSRLLALAPERGLLSASAVVFAGFSLARFLGFLFSIAAARLLAPPQFGRLAYALAIVGLASLLLSGAPNGLARFLARQQGMRGEQEAVLTNWVALELLLLAISALVALPAALLAGLSPAMVVGVAANLVGIAALSTYREVQRGLGKYWEMAVYYVAANLLQLVAVLALSLVGIRSAAAFLVVYGLSGLAPLALLEAARPMGITLRAQLFDRDRVVTILRFVWPVLLQSVFFAVWITADQILVQWWMGSVASGNYGAAKTLANLLILPSAAIGTAVGPRVAQLAAAAVPNYVAAALALTAALTLPMAATLAVLATPICRLLFGSRYSMAPSAEPMLAAGMVLFSLYAVLSSTWIGLGRPRIDALATGTAMVVTVVTGVILVPRLGLSGAATGFALGGAARLAIISVFTAWRHARSLAPVELALKRTA